MDVNIEVIEQVSNIEIFPSEVVEIEILVPAVVEIEIGGAEQGPAGPQGVQGVQGIQGIQGVQGIPGDDGNFILGGPNSPSSGDGANTDFWVDTATGAFWGPKASGAWPSPPVIFGGYTHVQAVSSDTWIVNHNLGREPAAVSVVDSTGRVGGAGITHTSVNQTILTLGAAMSGRAHLR